MPGETSGADLSDSEKEDAYERYRVLGDVLQKRNQEVDAARVPPPPIEDRHLPQFDPHGEVYGILERPSGELREEALHEYKVKLRHQLEALAYVQEQLIVTVEANPDITSAELTERVDAFKVQFGLSD